MSKAYNGFNKKFHIFKLLSIFVVCTAVYLANNRTISAGDTVPNTLLAFNFLENHTLNFDNFRGSYFFKLGDFYPFVESFNGHLTSAYPIGTAILTFPLYLIFYLYLKITLISIDLTNEDFEIYRVSFEKLSATIITSISIVIFYLSSQIKFNRSKAFISTFIYAFATNTWMTSSQGLWQHGISNLAVVSIIFCLLQANRTKGRKQRILLLISGLFCGLLPGIRPTSVLFAIAAVVYSVFTYRTLSTFLLIGLFSALPSVVWNLYYFDNLTGGYSKLFGSFPYLFTFNHFIGTSKGILVSPNRGLFVFSPIVLYSYIGAYKVFKIRYYKDEKLIAAMSIASIVLFINYCFYTTWWAGHSYGPRFMTDIIPVVCYLINYSPISQFINSIVTKKTFNSGSIIFLTLLTFSIFTQAVGAFGNTGILWNPIPLNVDQYNYRLWEFRDSLIERHTRALFSRIIKPHTDSLTYIQGLSGIIKEIRDGNNQPLIYPISITPGANILLKTKLENTGTSKWLGYESAIEKGEVRVRARIYSSDNEQVSDNRLYITGTTKQKEVTNAIGSINFPKERGSYKLVFDLIAEGVSEFPKKNKILFPELKVKVDNERYLSTDLHLNNSGSFPYPQNRDSADSTTTINTRKKRFAQEIHLLEQLKSGNVGEATKVLVSVKNTSNFVWDNKGSNPVNFSYHWLDSKGKIVVYDGERTGLSGSLTSQESAQLNAVIKFPNSPGNYTLTLTMVQEGVAWFIDVGAQALTIPVTVTSK